MKMIADKVDVSVNQNEEVLYDSACSLSPKNDNPFESEF